MTDTVDTMTRKCAMVTTHPNNGARRKKDTMQNTDTDAAAAAAADKAAGDEVVKAERFVLMAVEFAQYALEDYADRPAIAALLDALTTYQAAQTAREAAGTALIDALTKALDQRDTPTTKEN